MNDNKFDESMDKILKLLEELRKLMKAKNRLNGETLLDNQDLCLLLHLSKRSLQRYRSSGILPFIQIGSKTFYLESEVEKFIRQYIDKESP
ncbi:DNA-binding protein [Dysgonomonas sp. 521]|nr:DNA-binding protein [Dysgonomonas sp. 521]